jgi:hypothetical protein
MASGPICPPIHGPAVSPVDPDRRDARDAVAVGVMVNPTGPSAEADPVVTRGRRYGPDVLGVLWVLGAGLAVLLPALIHGLYLGPYDILSTIGLTAQHGVVVHNPSMRDLTSLFIPFTEQNWIQVHQGHLPLWNPYSGLGMPLAFNWESAPFGLPALIGYLVPLRFAYTTGVLVTVAVTGTGAYVFGRVLRLGVVASAFIGTVFVLGGPVMSLVGWSSTSVSSWTGWLFAAAVVVVRGKRRALSIGGLALVLALSIYAGHPETTLLLWAALALFVAVVLVQRAPRLGDSGPILRPVIDLVIGGVAGLGLSAPLLLPGMQLLGLSGRTSTGNYSSVTVPDHAILQLIFQGFDGLPVAGSHWFGSVSYQWTANYVGLITLVLAVVALGTRWKRPEVTGLVAVVAVMGALALIPSVASAFNGLPLIGNVILTRALVPLAFALAVLGGIGLDALARDPVSVRIRHWAGWGFGGAALLLLAVWVFGRGHLPTDEARIRSSSFLWPALGAVLGLILVIWLSWTVRHRTGSAVARRAQLASGLLLLCETAFLVTAGMPVWTSSSQPPSPTPAVVSLQNTVGTSLVGLGNGSCVASTFLGDPELGILPEANIAYQVKELAIYDPLVPSAYFSSWKRITGMAGGSSYYYLFCPSVTSVAAARRFGVGYVLEFHGQPGPVGSVFVRKAGDEELYRIPGAASATLVSAPEGKALPGDDAPGTPVTVHQPDPATWHLVTDASTPKVLRLRLTDVPGWHATIDGRPLALQTYSGVMLQARIPTGRHSVVIRYWPTPFTVGLVVAACGAVGLLAAIVLEWVRRRKGHQSRMPLAPPP